MIYFLEEVYHEATSFKDSSTKVKETKSF
ncbi:hypothetical protein MNBD_NITROSPIRAE03-291, partial [hydrothermal vent metagenome]